LCVGKKNLCAILVSPPRVYYKYTETHTEAFGHGKAVIPRPLLVGIPLGG